MITKTWITESGEHCRLKWIGSVVNYQKESSHIKMAVAFDKHKKTVARELNMVRTWVFRWRYRRVI